MATVRCIVLRNQGARRCSETFVQIPARSMKFGCVLFLLRLSSYFLCVSYRCPCPCPSSCRCYHFLCRCIIAIVIVAFVDNCRCHFVLFCFTVVLLLIRGVSRLCPQYCSHPAVSGESILAVNKQGVHFLHFVSKVSWWKAKWKLDRLCYSNSIEI